MRVGSVVRNGSRSVSLSGRSAIRLVSRETEGEPLSRSCRVGVGVPHACDRLCADGQHGAAGLTSCLGP